MAVLFSPFGNSQYIDENGEPAVGFTVTTYAAGSSALLASFTSSTGLVPNANPTTLNAAGLNPDGQFWLTSGLAYKFVIKDAGGVEVDTVDGVSGVNDPAAISAANEWVAYSGTPTYINATSFSVIGDQTTTFQVKRRVRTTNTSGTAFSTISISSFSAGITTVTVVNDAGDVLDAGLSAVSYGFLSPDDPSVPGSYAKSGANSDITSLTAVTSITGVQTITGLVGPGLVPVGFILYHAAPTAPTGYLACEGLSIGNAASGGTARANADTEALFTLLWGAWTNTDLAIQTSAGAGTTRGASAAADFAANKRLPLPDFRGEFLRVFDAGRGVDAGRGFGSAQSFAQQNITGSMDLPANTAQFSPSASGILSGGTGGAGVSINGASGTMNRITLNASGQIATAAEVRPRNIAILTCIKY